MHIKYMKQIFSIFSLRKWTSSNA